MSALCVVLAYEADIVNGNMCSGDRRASAAVAVCAPPALPACLLDRDPWRGEDGVQYTGIYTSLEEKEIGQGKYCSILYVKDIAIKLKYRFIFLNFVFGSEIVV